MNEAHIARRPVGEFLEIYADLLVALGLVGFLKFTIKVPANAVYVFLRLRIDLLGLGFSLGLELRLGLPLAFSVGDELLEFRSIQEQVARESLAKDRVKILGVLGLWGPH